MELSKLLQDSGPIIERISAQKAMEIGALGFAYQSWYTRALSIVSSIAPDRLEEFKGHYINSKRKELNALTYTLSDYLQGLSPVKNIHGNYPYDHHTVAGIRFLNQHQILASLSERLDTVLSDVRGHLFVELQDAELRAASKLIKVSHRAAGALAGVVLERHLRRAAENHQVKIAKKDPTISDLNDPLKAAGVIDVAVWRRIQLLGDLRNLCSHQKSREPTLEEVTELIAGVNSIIKSVF